MEEFCGPKRRFKRGCARERESKGRVQRERGPSLRMATQPESTRKRPAKAGRIDVAWLSRRGKDGVMAWVAVVVVGEVFARRHLVVAVVTEDHEAKSRGALTFSAV